MKTKEDSADIRDAQSQDPLAAHRQSSIKHMSTSGLGTRNSSPSCLFFSVKLKINKVYYFITMRHLLSVGSNLPQQYKIR